MMMIHMPQSLITRQQTTIYVHKHSLFKIGWKIMYMHIQTRMAERVMKSSFTYSLMFLLFTDVKLFIMELNIVSIANIVSSILCVIECPICMLAFTTNTCGKRSILLPSADSPTKINK